MSEHFVGRVAQKALIVKGKKVLITRDSRDEKTWELPGGRLDAGEEPVEGLKREMREELGVEIKVSRIIDITRMYHARDDEWMLAVYYEVNLFNESAEFTVDPVEIAEYAWIDKNDLENYILFPEYQEAVTKFFNTTS